MTDQQPPPGPRRTPPVPVPLPRPSQGGGGPATAVETPAQIFAAHHAAFPPLPPPIHHPHAHSHHSSPSRTPTSTSLAHAPSTAHLLHPQMVRDGLERHLGGVGVGVVMGPPPPPGHAHSNPGSARALSPPPPPLPPASAPPTSSASASASITTTHPLFPTPRSLPPFPTPPLPPPPAPPHTHTRTPPRDPNHPPPHAQNHHAISPKMDLSNILRRDWVPPPPPPPQPQLTSSAPGSAPSSSPAHLHSGPGSSSSPQERDRERERERERSERDRFRAIAPAPQQQQQQLQQQGHHHSTPPFVGAGGTSILSPSHIAQQQRDRDEARFSAPAPRRSHREREQEGGFNINPHLNTRDWERERERGRERFIPPSHHHGVPLGMGGMEAGKAFPRPSGEREREHVGYYAPREEGVYGERERENREREREREWERGRERDARENTLPPLNVLHPHPPPLGPPPPPPPPPQQQQHMHMHPGPPSLQQQQQHMQRSPERERIWGDPPPPPPPGLIQHQQQQQQQQQERDRQLAQREREQQAREQQHLEQQLQRENERGFPSSGGFTLSVPPPPPRSPPSSSSAPPFAPGPRNPLPIPIPIPPLPHLGTFHRPSFPPPRIWPQVPATFDLLLDPPSLLRALRRRENGSGGAEGWYVFGTGVYTDDSDPVGVGVHAGLVGWGEIARSLGLDLYGRKSVAVGNGNGRENGNGKEEGGRKRVLRLKMRVSERRARYVGSVGGEGVESRTWTEGHDGWSMECVGKEWVEGLPSIPHALRTKLASRTSATLLPLLFPTALLSTLSPSHARTAPYDWLSLTSDLRGHPRRRLVDVVKRAEGAKGGVGAVGWEECVWGTEGREGREGGAGVLGMWEAGRDAWMVYAPREVEELVEFARGEEIGARGERKAVKPPATRGGSVRKRFADSSPPQPAPPSIPADVDPGQKMDVDPPEPPAPSPSPAFVSPYPHAPTLRTHSILLHPTSPPGPRTAAFLLRLTTDPADSEEPRMEVLSPSGSVVVRSDTDALHWTGDGLARIRPAPPPAQRKDGDAAMGIRGGRKRNEWRVGKRLELVCAVESWRWVRKEDVGTWGGEGAAKGEVVGLDVGDAAGGGERGKTADGTSAAKGPAATGFNTASTPFPTAPLIPAVAALTRTSKRKRSSEASDASVSSAEEPRTPVRELEMDVPRKTKRARTALGRTAVAVSA